MTLVAVLTALSGVAFVGYGVQCLASGRMRHDFQRFGLEPLRTLTGWAEIAGGVGLLLGLRWPIVRPLAAGGLSLLMLCGVIVRIRNGDSLRLALPASLLMLVNGYIMAEGLRR